MTRNKFEILAPAGSFEILKAVIEAGADAVYVGGSQYGARAYADNFSEEELLEALDYAHLRGKKIYLTVNTLMKNQEIGTPLYEYLLPYYKHGLDAVIVQDIGAITYIRTYFPELPIHASTQMTVTGVMGARLMKELGVSRVVTAREMSLDEIREIHENVDIEIETFVHGALCYCYSGQCLMSSMLGGRSGNRGRCAQPCRLAYSVYDASHREICKDSYVLSPKDMCGIEFLPKMNESGIYSLKIEGRMKQVQYAAGVVSYYRKYVDQFMNSSEGAVHVTKQDQKDILDLGNRSGFTNAYLTRHNGKDMITFTKPNHQKANETLQNRITEQYAQTESKIGIDGILRLRKGEAAELTVSDGRTEAVVTGNVVQQAEKKPLLKEEVEKRFKKTGDTSFVFQNLSIEMDADAFMPVGAMNQLRRDALQKLQDQLLEPVQRKESDQKAGNIKRQLVKNVRSPKRYIAATEQRILLPVILQYAWITDVYMDSTAYSSQTIWSDLKEDVNRIHGAGKKAQFILPAIFRQSTSEFYTKNQERLLDSGIDGIVVKNYEELQFASKLKDRLEVYVDHNMYTYNNYAVDTFMKYGINGNTVPIELNRNEIRHRENAQSEIIVYGRYPLMTSAQCVHGNTVRCDRKPQIMWLKDRYQKEFPVRNNCNECYNIIYNSLPVSLLHCYTELTEMNLNGFRLQFTIETEKQAKEVLTMFQKIINGERINASGMREFTNGHYKRGVE